MDGNAIEEKGKEECKRNVEVNKVGRLCKELLSMGKWKEYIKIHCMCE